MNYTIGIDNGLDGAISVVGEYGGIIFKTAMPTIKTGKGREVDVLAINEIFNQYPGTIVLEEASKHSPGKLSLCSTWFTYGSILSTIKLAGRRYQVIRPLNWQKTFWAKPKMAKDQKFDTKAAALKAANMLWPEENWTKSDKATKPHDGMVDAALIAEWARRQRL